MRRIAERIEPEEDFTQHLVDIFGVNHFGDPMFRFIWGMTETAIRLMPLQRYNSQTKQFESYYDEVLVGHNQPCWILQDWKGPETFGEPEFFYYMNRDDATGLPLMEYPEFGMYQDLVTFQSKRINPATKELEIETIELDWEIIDAAIPLMLRSLELTEAQKKATIEAQEAYENTQVIAQIADRLYDSLPTFYGPTSHAQIANKTALIDRKMAEVERSWRGLDLRKRPMRGFFQN